MRLPRLSECKNGDHAAILGYGKLVSPHTTRAWVPFLCNTTSPENKVDRNVLNLGWSSTLELRQNIHLPRKAT